MRERFDIPLASSTTLRLGGPAKRVVSVETADDLVEVVRACDAADEPTLVLGGGSNLVVSDAGFPGTVVEVATRGITVESVSDCAGATVRVAAGENWDDFVQSALASEWVGVEALSGIPGLVGAAPMQNIGAYGQSLAETVAQVRAYSRDDDRVMTIPLAECGFGYRTSRFKREPGRWVVLEVVFQFALGSLSAPIRYAEVARRLDVPLETRVPLATLRSTVLELRRGKGMVLDPSDNDTWSAGSFFTNPLLSSSDADLLPADAPRWPAEQGLVKTSAAWLIEHAGFTKGYGDGPARVSTKHTLALTNRGAATTEDLLRLAREIRDGVRAAYGITLEPEPVLVGATL